MRQSHSLWTRPARAREGKACSRWRSPRSPAGGCRRGWCPLSSGSRSACCRPGELPYLPTAGAARHAVVAGIRHHSGAGDHGRDPRGGRGATSVDLLLANRTRDSAVLRRGHRARGVRRSPAPSHRRPQPRAGARCPPRADRCRPARSGLGRRGVRHRGLVAVRTRDCSDRRDVDQGARRGPRSGAPGAFHPHGSGGSATGSAVSGLSRSGLSRGGVALVGDARQAVSLVAGHLTPVVGFHSGKRVSPAGSRRPR